MSSRSKVSSIALAVHQARVAFDIDRRTYLASFSALLFISLRPLVSFLYVVLRLSKPSAGTVSSEGHVESNRFTRPIVS